MGKVNTVFKRYEKKYLLTASQHVLFRELADEYMQVDEYGESTVCNIYYDTLNYDLIRASIEKPVYKEKLRLRSYGVPKQGDLVFLEIKKKYKGIVYKRRIALPYEEACRSMEQGAVDEGRGQVAKEINYFLKRYHLVPKVYLAYDRIAMYGMEDADLRMTFDFRVRSRKDKLDLALGDAGRLLFADGEVILEIKVKDVYPMWLIRGLEKLSIHVLFQNTAMFTKSIFCPAIWRSLLLLHNRAVLILASNGTVGFLAVGYGKRLVKRKV